MHLNSYARYYLPAIEKAIKAQGTKNATVLFNSGWLGSYFTKLMSPSGSGSIKKMKSPQDHAPKSILDSHLVISEFIDHQEKLLSLIEAATHADLNRIRVPVSLSKWITLKLGDTFRFFVAHEYRISCRHRKPWVQALHRFNLTFGQRPS
jgi:hypothetical protein